METIHQLGKTRKATGLKEVQNDVSVRPPSLSPLSTSSKKLEKLLDPRRSRMMYPCLRQASKSVTTIHQLKETRKATGPK